LCHVYSTKLCPDKKYTFFPYTTLFRSKNSAISEANIEDFNFDEIFEGKDLFHISGITPIISKNGAKLTLEALKYAKKYNVKVSLDRKSTRLNSSHVSISYAVFCLKKKL